jgi:aminopeptidase N
MKLNFTVNIQIQLYKMKRILIVCFLIQTGLIALAQPGGPNAGKDTSWKKNYRATYTTVNDLIHTKLDVKFDYDKSYMYGKAWITLKPHFYATDSVTLDAKGMDIKKVAVMNGSAMKGLKYNYDGMLLKITLDKTYKGSEKYTLYIDYTSKPNEMEMEGSAAISDAKGLYFINPKGEDTDKPTQIWTQGETEATSVWCPTIDKPNQKTTQEISMTVPARYVTLSNGLLTSQKKNTDGTRTDYWKMDLPHAPYLFFMGVGDYAVVKDSYKGKEVSYFVEKEYAPVARKIFGNTPEMMAFFSKITGVDYPWSKYAQMTARDYVSGAMENTTATLHQENSQQDARALLDGNNWESTIAHELFHQWFGDYVTCESWSNLTLNESFANYSETLWDEYKYGKDAGDAQNYSDMRGYLQSRSEKKHLVRFYYVDKEEMFDAVSYNKGGRILHMLRNYLGDDAFFKGMNLYLTANKFKAAEAHQLRLAMEEVSGRDLNWFFNQWYFGSGHPQLDINYNYDDAAKKVTVIIKQTQSDKVFRLPFAIDVYNGSAKTRHNVWMEEKEQSFTFSYDKKPELVNVDGDKILLCTKKDNKTLDNYIHQYKYAKKYLDRREAILSFAKNQADPKGMEMLKAATKDEYHGLRIMALDSLDLENPATKAAVEPLILDIAKNDKKTTVRAAAIRLLSTYNKESYLPLFKTAMKDSSYSIASAGLDAVAELDPPTAIAEAKKIMDQKLKGVLAESALEIANTYRPVEDFDEIVAALKKLPLSNEKFTGIMSFAKFLSRVENTDRFKSGIDMVVAFRDVEIPAGFREQTNPVLNDLLKGIISKKEAAKSKGDAAAIQQQIDYVNSMLKKGF